MTDAARDRLPDELPPEPMAWAERWLDEAMQATNARNPNAMTLVTVGADRRPSARVVLCKSLVADPGYVVFYTNYESRKGRELAANPESAAVFYWEQSGRQIRLEGPAVRSPGAESDAYFGSRPWGSKLGAWGSDQSCEVASRAELLAQLRERAADLGIRLADDIQTLASGAPPPIERPPHWGGYRLWVRAIELWVEGSDRIHDRARWTRELEAAGKDEFAPGAWRAARLQP